MGYTWYDRTKFKEWIEKAKEKGMTNREFREWLRKRKGIKIRIDVFSRLQKELGVRLNPDRSKKYKRKYDWDAIAEYIESKFPDKVINEPETRRLILEKFKVLATNIKIHLGKRGFTVVNVRQRRKPQPKTEAAAQ